VVSRNFSKADAGAFAGAARAAANYRLGVGSEPIPPRVQYPQSFQAFDEPLPQTGLPSDEVISDLVAKAGPGLTGFTHPNFHGWVTGASHPAGVAADWLAAAWGQVASSAGVTPAAAAVEEVAGRWVLELLDLPREAGFGVVTGTTMANFVGLAAARNEMLARAGWDVEAKGLFGAPEVHVVLGGEAHSSVYLTLRLLGFGAERVHIANSDDQGRMIPGALKAVLKTLDGPVVVCLQAGNVNSGAFDPFDDLIPIARNKGAWVHVDGAFGLWARAARSLDDVTRGLENADSWAADAHKWLQVPYDCGLSVVRNTAAMQRAMNITASYLVDSAFRDPNSFVPEMSRRARGFSLWAVLKALGRDGVEDMVDRHCAVARLIRDRVSRETGLNVLNNVVLNQVVIACGDRNDQRSDGLTKATLAEVQSEGLAFPSHGQWQDREILRVSVSSGPTGEEDGNRTAEAIINAWRKVKARNA